MIPIFDEFPNTSSFVRNVHSGNVYYVLLGIDDSYMEFLLPVCHLLALYEAELINIRRYGNDIHDPASAHTYSLSLLVFSYITWQVVDYHYKTLN